VVSHFAEAPLLLAVANPGSFFFRAFAQSARQPYPRRTGDSGAPVIPELWLCPATSQSVRRLRTSIALSSAGVPGKNSVHTIPPC